MSKKYKLTCLCGETHLVETRQAGTTLRCRCGALLDVPSLRELTTLPPDDTPRPRRRLVAVWGTQQVLLAIGAVFLVVGALGAAYLRINKPRLLDVDHLSPIQTWMLWQELRQGPDRRPSPGQQRYVQSLRDNRFRLQIMLVFAGAGCALMLGGLLVPRQWQRGSESEMPGSRPSP